MSEFHVQVVRVGPVEKHPNADTLGVTKVFDYPVIVKLGELNPGDLAVYVPVDSVVPIDDTRWAFLEGHNRIKARKLRGVFSMGLLVPAATGWVEGQDVCAEMRITKYDPPEPMATGGDNESNPGFMQAYTDVEALRRYPDVLTPGEEVVISEKLHGANGRFVYQNERLWCGSHHNWKKPSDAVLWWKVAAKHELERKLQRRQDLGFYGEVFGRVQDMTYGAGKNELFLRFFDVIDLKSRRYLNHDEAVEAMKEVEVEPVPLLYRGSWAPELRAHAEGQSTIPDAGHVREGMVVKPVKERWDARVGRVVLKYHGEGYLTRKDKK